MTTIDNECSDSPVSTKNPTFPIDLYRKNIVTTLMTNSVTSIALSTGSGKTTRVPVYILEEMMSSHKSSTNNDWCLRSESQNFAVFVTVPTILAVRSLTTYQQQLSPNIQVGCAAGGERWYGESTDLIYCTTGHLVKRVIVRLSHLQQTLHDSWKNHPVVNFCSWIMIDEVHTATSQNYILMRLLHYLTRHQPDLTPRIVFSSATLSSEVVHALFPKAATVDYTVPSYPIETRFVFSDDEMVDPFRDMVAVRNKALNLITNIDESCPRGEDILLFCPGSTEVEEIIDMLTNHNSLVSQTCEVLRCYSSISEEESFLLTAPLDSQSGKRRKVFVATNVAESSITLPGVVHVVDLMLEKVMSIDPITSCHCLQTQVITMSSSAQRKGRCGRVRPGIYYPMVNQRFYNTRLKAHNENEFFRTDNTSTILEFLSYRLDPREILQFPKSTYTVQVKRLLEMRLLRQIKLRPIKKKITLYHRQRYSRNYDRFNDSEEDYDRDDFGDSDDDDDDEEEIVRVEDNPIDLDPSNLEVTDSGRFCSQLPMKVTNGNWLFHYIHPVCEVCQCADECRCLVTFLGILEEQHVGSTESESTEKRKEKLPLHVSETLVVLICMLEILENQTLQWFPRKMPSISKAEYSKLMAKHKKDHFQRFKGVCDFETLLNYYYTIQSEVQTSLEHSRSPGRKKLSYHEVLKRWMMENSFNIKAWSQIQGRIKQTKRSLDALGVIVDRSFELSSSIMDRIRKAFVNSHPNNRLSVGTYKNNLSLNCNGHRASLNERTSYCNMTTNQKTISELSWYAYSKLTIQPPAGFPFHVISYVTFRPNI